VNSREFRKHIAQLLAKQNPDPPVKAPSTDTTTTKPSPMTNREFRKHIGELLVRQRNQDQPATKKPPLSEAATKPAVNEKKPPTSVMKTFKARRSK